MALVRWSPRRELQPLAHDPFFNRFLDLFGSISGEERAWFPAVDLMDEKERLVARVEVPGCDAKDVAVSLEGDTLTVSGERHSEHKEEEGSYLRREQFYGSFQRSVQLPYRVDASKVKAQCKNGVMTISLPKSEEHIGRQIPVETE
jgi:HSP20 family protein